MDHSLATRLGPHMLLRRVLPAVLASSALVLAACGSSSSSTVDNGKLEKDIRTEAQQGGGSVQSVDCPSGKDLKTGEKFTCTLKTTSAGSFPVPVKVTSESAGGQASFLIPRGALTGR